VSAPRRRSLLGILVLMLLGAGCGEPTATAPACDEAAGNAANSTAILLAQAVPDAELIPCVDTLPTGWELAATEISSAGAEFVFNHDRAGARALVLTFSAACAVDEATMVPSDEPGADRYELVREIRGGYDGTRFYTYAGGCTAYAFDIPGSGWSPHVGDMTSALSFRSREEVDALAHSLLSSPPSRSR
jgi:hypothetical protein